MEKSHFEGKIFEDRACAFLEKKGFKIIERNFRCPFGELDIIAKERDVLCFVEVKMRKRGGFVPALESLDSAKISKIRKSALFYLAGAKQAYKDVRYDFICIEKDSNLEEFEFIKGAFDHE